MGNTISRLVILVLLACSVLQCSNARASSFKLSFDPKKTCSAIEIKGELKAGDYNRFVQILKRANAVAPLRRIYLNSEGGQLLAAMAITDVIRNTVPAVETIVQSQHICNSACNIILTVGSRHHVSRHATLIIHQVFDEKTGKRDAATTKEIGLYLAANGLPTDVISTMSNLSPKDQLTITSSNAKKLGFDSFYFYGSTRPPATPQCSWKGPALKGS